MIKLEAKRTALLVMDMQVGVLNYVGPQSASLVERVAVLVAAARAAGVPVIFVVVNFRSGYPEVSANNQSFKQVAATGLFQGVPGADIVPALAPAPSEVVVAKHRVSAFAGTDLEVVLRAKGIDTLVLAGIATSGVVLSTLRHAADVDYRAIVVEDCCADADAEVHRVLTEKVFVRQATVAAMGDVVAAFAGKGP